MPRKEGRFLSSEEEESGAARDPPAPGEGRSPNRAACSPSATEDLGSRASAPCEGFGAKEKGVNKLAAIKAGRHQLATAAAERSGASAADNEEPDLAPEERPEAPASEGDSDEALQSSGLVVKDGQGHIKDTSDRRTLPTLSQGHARRRFNGDGSEPDPYRGSPSSPKVHCARV
uniref:Uncharacterized protein n=1 Tax=Sphaerodactylus townsendi TaxID=933632 RepID=A0ACB8E5P1_9SAUR